MPALSKSDYNVLVNTIIDIYNKAQAQAHQALDQIRTQAYWDIGQHIVKVEQKNNIRAQYGEKLIQNLSEELTSKCGKGFSLTNLKYIRQFYKMYPKGPTCDQLGWSKQKVLLSIKNDEIRQKYKEKAVKNNWSVKELTRVLKKDKIPLAPISKNSYREFQLSLVAPMSPARLKFLRGRPGLFKVREEKGLQIKDPHKTVDLGFKVSLDSLKKDSPFLLGDIVTPKGSPGSWTFSKVDANKKELYTYIAEIKRVVDGDTLVVTIDFGLDVYKEERLRLRGINAPELSTRKGKRAKGFCERTLNSAEFIIIKTYSTDIYDRYLADIFYLVGENDPQKVAEKGLFFNQELLDAGLASLYIPKG